VGDAKDLLINLLAALIGIILAQAWRQARRRVKYRASRAFWAPFLASPSHILISEVLSDEMRIYEMSGLTGLGEVHSLIQMMTKFTDARMYTDMRVATPTQSAESVMNENLILLGGPDVNSATVRVVEALNPSLVVARDEADKNIVLDRLTDTIYRPELSSVSVSGRRLDRVHDYGIILRTKNPFNAGRHILLLMGAYGYGTLAAVQACLDEAKELEVHSQRLEGQFECLVSYSMSGGPPGLVKIESVRKLGMDE
jgi:hypothetical protein